MDRKHRRAKAAPRLERLETRTLLSVDGWQGYALNPQHTALSPVASANLGMIHWQTPVDLDPQYSGSDLLIHYGSPLVTAANTVLVPVKTGATGGFEVQSLSGATGTLRWTLTTDYVLPPSGGTNGYSWTPSYSPTLTPSNQLDLAGDGGTIVYTNSPDASGPSPPATTREAFFGIANYNANPSAYNSTVFINTPITTDSAGDIFFGFLVTGSNPLGLKSGVARIGADGTGSYVGVVSGTSQVATNSAPALSNDGSTLYVLESAGNFSSGKLVALNSSTLAVKSQVTLMDPHNTGNPALIPNDGTASPIVGPDGDVYIGVLENPFASNNDRGWLLHFSSDLSTSKTPGAFGWDDTPSVVPASMVPSYSGSSTYLLMTKYNNYAGEGGDGLNKLAILDPNAQMTDPVTGAKVMKEVLTIIGPTPDSEFTGSHPGAVREWCINSAAVDPATDSILAGSEDGTLYRWNLTTNTFTQHIALTTGIGEAYTPTLIGVDGTVYAINNATLFAVGGPISDAGFEQVQVGSGQYKYQPTGSPWTFSPSTGLSGNNSAFTSGNPPALEGAQVAFLQLHGTISESVAGWAAGTYKLSFYAAQRGNVPSQQDFQVLVDGAVVGTFKPSGTSYQTYTTNAFNIAAGTHTIMFRGLDTVGGDNTAFIDAVTRVVVNPIGDAGFEQVQVGSGQYKYQPTGSPWTFSPSTGLSGNNSAFTSGNPPAPEGAQVAFLQLHGTISESVAGWAAGTYKLSFYAAQRGNVPSQQDFQVLVDGAVVGTFKPSGTSYQTYTTNAFNIAAGTHTIMFRGLDTVGGDNTAFIDAVVPVSLATLSDTGFEQVQVGGDTFQYRPTGSPWTFAGEAGLSGYYSGFTSGNPQAPEGVQVAFLQGTGSFSQSVSGWAAGTYKLSFYAAQRSNNASQQNFQVLVDGVAVGTFTPSGTTYQTSMTSSFTVAAGAHTIQFVGLDSAGGDNTALIDQILVIS